MSELPPGKSQGFIDFSVGHETYVVETYPIRETTWPIPDPALRRLDNECLVITPPRKRYLVFLLLAVAAAAVYAVAELLHRRASFDSCGLALLVSALLFGLAVLKGYFANWRLRYALEIRFDRKMGQMVWKWKGHEAAIPLNSIVAVQVVVDARAGEHQLNLILNADFPELLRVSARTLPRKHLSQHKDGSRIGEIGRQLADFLGVPFLNQSAETLPVSGLPG